MDSRAEPADNVRRALEVGLAGLTFTEHFDTHAEDWPECVYDDDAIRGSIQELREQFAGRIFIGKGIEVCYQPQQMDQILDMLEHAELDLVLLSVHYFPAAALHVRAGWEPMTVERATERYLSHVLEAVRFVERLHRRRGQVFHVLGHLDLIKRYSQRFHHAHDVSPHGELIERILTSCLEARLVPEINTSSLRQGLAETMPGPETVRRYAALGGKAMSLGSDSNKAEDIGAGFTTAVQMLREAGIQHEAVFKNRELELVPCTA